VTDPIDRSPSGGLVPAFQSLTDGLVSLLRNHLQLFRHELQSDAKLAAEGVATAVAFGLIGLVGYFLLNIALILTAYAVAGVIPMVAVCGGLSLFNLVVGFGTAKRIVDGMREKSRQLGGTQSEIERSKTWIKELKGP
jgi:hypothetical protein